jgi:signal transduction histidine kinase
MATVAGPQTEAGSSEREESVGLAARALAHDFNNLLAAIVGHASYLRMITEPGGEVDQTAATIEMAAVRAKGLADQLHQLGSVQVPARAPMLPVDLHAIVNEVVATLQTGQTKKVRFSVKLGAAKPSIYGDAGQLNQLVMNLAVNAGEAMNGAGGEIEIETTSLDRAVQLEVRDCGLGIPAECRGRIFDTSYSTKPTGGGMGLAIVQRIARDHGATIDIVDNQPRGTVFRLRFPQP